MSRSGSYTSLENADPITSPSRTPSRGQLEITTGRHNRDFKSDAITPVPTDLNVPYSALASSDADEERNVTENIWNPFTLKPWFAGFFLIVVFILAIALEVALHFSRSKTGWAVPNTASQTTEAIHYATRLVPVGMAILIIALWSWTDTDIKRLQPFIELSAGNARASRSLFIDYVNSNYAIAFVDSLRNNHYIVSLSSAILILGLCVQPLAASLFSINDTWWRLAEVTKIRTLDIPGLDLTYINGSAVTAAIGLASAAATRDIPLPMFVQDSWALQDIELPIGKVANGTMYVNVTAIRSRPNCQKSTNVTLRDDISPTFDVLGEVDGCEGYAFVSPITNKTYTYQPGIETNACPNESNVTTDFNSVAFAVAYVDTQGKRDGFVALCRPTIELLIANIKLELKTGQFVVQNFRSYTLPNNITDTNGFLKGRAFNGLGFTTGPAGQTLNFDGEDLWAVFTTALKNKALRSSIGLQGLVRTGGMLRVLEVVYGQYLSVLAKGIYFVKSDDTQLETPAFIETWQPRVLIVDSAVHLLSSVLLIICICGIIVHIAHARARKGTILTRKPGILAAYIAYAANTDLRLSFSGVVSEKTFKDCMDQKRFRMDQQNGKIMVDDTVDGAKEEREDLEKIYLTSLWHIEHNEYNPGNGSIPHSKAAEPCQSNLKTPIRGIKFSSWTPTPLQPWFGITVIISMLIIAGAIIASTMSSQSRQGWSISNSSSETGGFLHYAQTLPPVAGALMLSIMWQWTDSYVKRMQPYIALSSGATGSRSLLLDYSTHPIIGMALATAKGHYLVVLSSLLVVLSMTFQPLTASIFVLRDTMLTRPDASITSLSVPGFNFSETAFSLASQFVQARSLYDVPFPNLVDDSWALADMDVPLSQRNSTAQVNTIGYRSRTSCQNVLSTNIQYTPNTTMPPGAPDVLTIQINDNCVATDLLLSEDRNSMGIRAIGRDCSLSNDTSIPDAFKPVVFYVPIGTPPFNESNQAKFHAVYCKPDLELLNVSVEVDLAKGNFTALHTMPYSQPNVVTDPEGLLRGRFLNGVLFTPITNYSDPLRNVFSNPADDHPVSFLTLSTPPAVFAAILQTAQNTPGGLQARINDKSLAVLVQSCYSTYINLAAKQLYFTEANEMIPATIRESESRLFMAPLSSYLLAAIFILSSLLGIIVHSLHRHSRQATPFPRQPNTLGTAFALTLSSNIGSVLDGCHNDVELAKTIGSRKFVLNKTTGGLHIDEERTGN